MACHPMRTSQIVGFSPENANLRHLNESLSLQHEESGIEKKDKHQGGKWTSLDLFKRDRPDG